MLLLNPSSVSRSSNLRKRRVLALTRGFPLPDSMPTPCDSLYFFCDSLRLHAFFPTCTFICICTFFATPCDSMHFFRLPATPSIFRRIFATPRYFLPIFWSKKLLGRWLTRPNALCLICFSTHTHKQQIHYIYHSKACDPRKKMCVAKRRSETCSLYFTRGFKVLRVTSCENFSFWFAQISMDRDNNSSSDTFQMIYIRILLSHTVR